MTSQGSDDRRIELEIEVPGTPEEVWRAIATGPGISSWYVPHTVEEHANGVATASFGPEPEMQVPGRVAAWEPPHRIVFDGGEGVAGLAFEWLVEGRGGGSCIVRLVNTGFGSGDEWDEQFDGMQEGWRMFLVNLRLHLEHFPGRTATTLQPTAVWAGTRLVAWEHLTAMLGIPVAPAVGERIDVTADAPPFGGTVADASPYRISLVLDVPAPGTAIITAEGTGAHTSVSTWSYLYGSEASSIRERDEPLWRRWLSDSGPATA